MRVCFDNVNFAAHSGPNNFGFRLANALMALGHDVTDKTRRYDIFLTFIESSYLSDERAKKVLRLDGIWFKEENFESNNALIKQCYETYDQIIMQSEFDKNMCFKHFGERENVHVIHNGIKLETFEPYEELKSENVYNFVCSASWHGQKRLMDNILLFQKLRAQILASSKKESKLIILGGGDAGNTLAGLQRDNMSMLHNVLYLGHRKPQECLRIYKSCDVMLHLAFSDHCPNSTLEAISQGCPIICTDSGGTKEIVRDNGLIIPETTPYNYELVEDFDKPYKLDLPDDIDVEKLVLEKKDKIDTQYLDIIEVAKKYIEVFEA